MSMALCMSISPFASFEIVEQIYSQGTINICPLFWVIPLSGMSSQIGVLVHEASHFKSNGGCADYLYGQDDCRLLAKKEPNLAVDNAESHMYFALAFLLGDT